MKINKSDGTFVLYDIEQIQKITFSNLITNNHEYIYTAIKSFNTLKNYPNPFSNSTTIEYEIKDDGDVSIQIFEITGKLIKNIKESHQMSGKHTVVWDCKNNEGNQISGGIYMCIIIFDNERLTTKMLQLK